MLKLIIINVLLFLFYPENQSIIGEWIDKEDNASIVKFDENKFYQIYEKDTIKMVGYTRDTVSCDLKYMDNTILGDFIKLKDNEGTCFEITSISDSILAYRYTVSGKLHVFSRKVE